MHSVIIKPGTMRVNIHLLSFFKFGCTAIILPLAMVVPVSATLFTINAGPANTSTMIFAGVHSRLTRVLNVGICTGKWMVTKKEPAGDDRTGGSNKVIQALGAVSVS